MSLSKPVKVPTSKNELKTQQKNWWIHQDYTPITSDEWKSMLEESENNNKPESYVGYQSAFELSPIACRMIIGSVAKIKKSQTEVMARSIPFLLPKDLLDSDVNSCEICHKKFHSLSFVVRSSSLKEHPFNSEENLDFTSITFHLSCAYHFMKAAGTPTRDNLTIQLQEWSECREKEEKCVVDYYKDLYRKFDDHSDFEQIILKSVLGNTVERKGKKYIARSKPVIVVRKERKSEATRCQICRRKYQLNKPEVIVRSSTYHQLKENMKNSQSRYLLPVNFHISCFKHFDGSEPEPQQQQQPYDMASLNIKKSVDKKALNEEEELIYTTWEQELEQVNSYWNVGEIIGGGTSDQLKNWEPMDEAAWNDMVKMGWILKEEKDDDNDDNIDNNMETSDDRRFLVTQNEKEDDQLLLNAIQQPSQLTSSDDDDDDDNDQTDPINPTTQ